MAAEPNAALLSAHNLACTLDEHILWRDVQITVRAGERWAVAGPSGSGKTRLLQTLAGLIPPSTGEIRFTDIPLASWEMPVYRAQVVYVAQRPMLPEGSVNQALAAPFRLHVHRNKRLSRETLRHYLDMLAMHESFLQQRTENLSGGEVQIVATLRALLIKPVILLLDEPTASLDAARAEQIEALLGDWLVGDSQRAYVWISHDRAQLARVIDKTFSLGPA